MALSVVDIYRNLPQTNCKDCGYATCLAFASMVVSEKLPLQNCPHIDNAIMVKCQQELDQQHNAGKWVKKDSAKDALVWAQQRAASMQITSLPERIGGELKQVNGETILELPYFADAIIIKKGAVLKQDGSELNRWEQVFIYNHLAQGGSAPPSGEWKGFEEIPNTISKIATLRKYAETPLIEKFKGHEDQLAAAAKRLSGEDVSEHYPSSDRAFLFRPLPRIPVLLLFWDEDPEDGFDAIVKLLFDATITAHLDVESIVFLSERLRQLLCGDDT